MLGTGNVSSSYADTSSMVIQEQSSINMSSTAISSRPRTSKLASYSLQGGYDKWVSLPGQVSCQAVIQAVTNLSLFTVSET